LNLQGRFGLFVSALKIPFPCFRDGLGAAKRELRVSRTIQEGDPMNELGGLRI
jgi:hypothetical protein